MLSEINFSINSKKSYTVLMGWVFDSFSLFSFYECYRKLNFRSTQRSLTPYYRDGCLILFLRFLLRVLSEIKFFDQLREVLHRTNGTGVQFFIQNWWIKSKFSFSINNRKDKENYTVLMGLVFVILI